MSKIEQKRPSNQNLICDENVTIKTGVLTEDAIIAPNGRLVDVRIKTVSSYENPVGKIITNESDFTILVPIAFRKAFDTAKTLKEGDRIYVKGEDKNDFLEKPGGYKKPYHVIFGYQINITKKA